jgi:hypothetical protein
MTDTKTSSTPVKTADAPAPEKNTSAGPSEPPDVITRLFADIGKDGLVAGVETAEDLFKDLERRLREYGLFLRLRHYGAEAYSDGHVAHAFHVDRVCLSGTVRDYAHAPIDEVIVVLEPQVNAMNARPLAYRSALTSFFSCYFLVETYWQRWMAPQARQEQPALSEVPPATLDTAAGTHPAIEDAPQTDLVEETAYIVTQVTPDGVPILADPLTLEDVPPDVLCEAVHIQLGNYVNEAPSPEHLETLWLRNHGALTFLSDYAPTRLDELRAASRAAKARFDNTRTASASKAATRRRARS